MLHHDSLPGPQIVDPRLVVQDEARTGSHRPEAGVRSPASLISDAPRLRKHTSAGRRLRLIGGVRLGLRGRVVDHEAEVPARDNPTSAANRDVERSRELGVGAREHTQRRWCPRRSPSG